MRDAKIRSTVQTKICGDGVSQTVLFYFHLNFERFLR
jgi:hypothetical protein